MFVLCSGTSIIVVIKLVHIVNTHFSHIAPWFPHLYRPYRRHPTRSSRPLVSRTTWDIYRSWCRSRFGSLTDQAFLNRFYSNLKRSAHIILGSYLLNQLGDAHDECLCIIRALKAIIYGYYAHVVNAHTNKSRKKKSLFKCGQRFYVQTVLSKSICTVGMLFGFGSDYNKNKINKAIANKTKTLGVY